MYYRVFFRRPRGQLPPLPFRELILGLEEAAGWDFNPVVALYVIIAVNVIVYAVTSADNLFMSSSPSWINELGFRPIAFFTDLSQWYRVFTAMFTHADIFHILFNMYFLYVFGRAVERILGPLRFTGLYIASGLLASLFHTVFVYLKSPQSLVIPSVGASGAISGVLGAYMVLFPGTRLSACFFMLFMPLCFETLAVYYLLFWFIVQVAEGYLSFSSSIAFFAHAGGFIAGVSLLGLLADKRRIRLLRFLTRAGSLFGILYFIPLRRRGLSSIAKTLFSLTATVLVAGSLLGYLKASGSSEVFTSYTIAWRVNDLWGRDKVLVYIPSAYFTPAYTATSLPAQIVVGTLAAKGLLLVREAPGTVEVGPLRPVLLKLNYGLRSYIPVTVRPLYLTLSYDASGVLNEGSVELYVSLPSASATIEARLNLERLTRPLALMATLSLLTLLATLLSFYVVLVSSEDYVISPA